MFFRFRQASFTVLLLIILIQLVLSPLLYSFTQTQEAGQTSTYQNEDKGSLTPKNEPFFVSQKQAQPHQYPALARRINELQKSAPEAIQPVVVAELKQSIQKELDVAKQSGAPLLRRLEYENWLQDQVQELDPNTSFKEKAAAAVNSILISAGSVFSREPDNAEPAPKDTILIPAKPSTFKFSDTDVKIQTLTPPHVGQVENKPRTLTSIFKQARQAFTSLWQASPALAEDPATLPSLADVQADNGEVTIDSNIESLAAELNYNPVAITNYIRSHVKYEPYFGAQKGSSGCLAQLICNDVDAASLTIALLRASGIPARYKHSFVRMPADQVKTLLGVDQVKTAYVALTNAGLSVKLVNTSIPEGTSIDDVDIENETQLALEWTWVESYLEYDERGGNISFASTKDAIAGFADDASLRAYLAAFPKKQWLSIEPLLNRSITRTRNPIAADSATIDPKQFWLNYYQYQGASGPITKFHDDVLSASGLDSNNPLYSSTFSLTPNKNNYDILPPALPYSLVASAVNSAGATILTAPYSVLPATWRQTVVITLKSQDGSQTFLDKTFFASEINNQSVYLRYNGATQTDVDVIASYGGLASTPAPLVEIVPYLEFAGQLQSGTVPIHIGDTLVLETKLNVNGVIKHDSQKFSTAGNEEGIFIAFSSIAPDANLDNLNESGLLAQGTAALARKYLQNLTTGRDTLSGALDYESGFRFMRAIVTQNRSLNTFGGFPTTFDFSGLTMDAATDVNDYSRRDNYKNHRDYFRLVFGLEASRYEGQLFTDVAGLDGIATVSGLQYAYAHPETYTVHTITSANQGEIAGLNISANVKQQITDAVAAGATASVPDKNIVKGNFQGILYALLNADGTGLYAIGEQVANGGFTSEGYEILNVLIGGRQYAQFINQNIGHPDNFIYQDENQDSPARTCRINRTVFLDIMANEGWQESYGLPCLREYYSFGTHDYTFIMTLNAAKFKSAADSVNYWRTNSFMRAQIALSVPTDNVATRHLFTFWGTYVYENKSSKKMGIYNPQQLVAHRLGDKIYEKYVSGNKILDQYAPALLGYPTNNKTTAPPHIVNWGLDTEGEYQSFIGGQIYQKTSGIDQTYYVPVEIASFYNASENCLTYCGTGGKFGFPTGDPKKKNDGITIKQDFEAGGGIIWNTQTGVVGTEYAANYYCDEIDTNSSYIIGKAALQGLWDGGSEFVKGAVIFGGATFAVGSAVDFIIGTHGGATIAAWGLIGTGVAYGITQVYNAGIDNVLSGINTNVQYEIKHSQCLARQAYLFTKYVPGFAAIMVGGSGLASKSAKELEGITLANNIFTASASDFIPRLKTAFADNLRVLLPVFKGKEKDIGSIVDNAQIKFNEESVIQVKQLNRSLTNAELSAIASKNFSNGLKEAVDILEWKKLPNLLPSTEDANFFAGGIAKSDGKFIMRGNKIVGRQGFSLNGEVKGVIDDGVLYYGKVGSNPNEAYMHSQFTGGKSVDSAFTLIFNNNGELIEYSNISGHFKPGADRLLLLDYILQESGVDLSKAVRRIVTF